MEVVAAVAYSNSAALAILAVDENRIPYAASAEEGHHTETGGFEAHHDSGMDTRGHSCDCHERNDDHRLLRGHNDHGSDDYAEHVQSDCSTTIEKNGDETKLQRQLGEISVVTFPLRRACND